MNTDAKVTCDTLEQRIKDWAAVHTLKPRAGVCNTVHVIGTHHTQKPMEESTARTDKCWKDICNNFLMN